jgi:ABC-type lipoprotein export system ATPase subunit
MALLACTHLSCDRGGAHPAGSSAVKDITADFDAGVFYGFHGPDGCGKGLLLNLLGLLEKPQSGSILFDGSNIAEAPDEEVTRVRNTAFGFLFAHPYLLPAFSVVENVAMPLFRFRGTELSTARKRTRKALKFAGIPHLEDHLAGRLEQSDRWRAAFARAIAHEPQVLIAVSPGAGDVLLPLAARAAKELGLCVLWAGDHNLLSRHAERIIEVEDGRFVCDTTRP